MRGLAARQGMGTEQEEGAAWVAAGVGEDSTAGWEQPVWGAGLQAQKAGGRRQRWEVGYKPVLT